MSELPPRQQNSDSSAHSFAGENPPEKIILLGSTGSIGTQTLEVIQRFPHRFQVEALTAGDNLILLAEQIHRFRPNRVVIRSESRIAELRALVPQFKGSITSGAEGLDELCASDEGDTLVVGLVGIIGLSPTLNALKSGKKVLTANKETFVAGGHLVKPYLDQIIPIDSEHSAIFQCLKNEANSSVKTVYLTASGGPFRTYTPEQMQTIQLADTLKHPNWVMGQKITVDCATMMNKGLEVIEAHWLFDMDFERIQILVHPQSLIHSAVEYVDGSILTQMGAPDMRVPIQFALGYPHRLDAEYEGSRLNLLTMPKLEFEPPDLEKFPCIRLAYEAGKLGSSATAVLNAADEEAVHLFLNQRIRFEQISKLIETALEHHQQDGIKQTPSLKEIVAYDQWARALVKDRQLSCLS